MTVFMLALLLLLGGVERNGYLNDNNYAYISEAAFNTTDEEKQERAWQLSCDAIAEDFEYNDWFVKAEFEPTTYKEYISTGKMTINCYITGDISDEAARETMEGFLDAGCFFEDYELKLIR